MKTFTMTMLLATALLMAPASREMFQLKVAMSYRAAAQLSQQEVAGAIALEARAYGNLAATCAPLLA